MKRAPRPPRLARRLLERALPADVREDVCGDLEEVFRRRCESGGPGRARLWYRREAVSFSGRFLWERLRGRGGRAGGRGEASAPRPLRRGGMRVGISWLDVRLGVRMLVKHPGLTLVGGLGIAVAVGIGGGFFAFFDTLLRPPPPPLDEGERVVAIVNWHVPSASVEEQTLHDFVTWRDELESVEDLAAFRTVERNLMVEGGAAGPVTVAEMTASGFRVARVPPVLGRPLVAEDAREGAPPAVVIGYDVWRTRFGSDAAVVGRNVRLGGTVHTVVGVMPEGFAFPMNHDVWTPFRADPSDYERRRGPAIFVFGRLTPGATIEEARAELTTIGRRAAAAFPETNEPLRPRIMPYTDGFLTDVAEEFPPAAVGLAQLLVTMLIIVPCANVAILVYARTANRRGEIAVRSALGASRRRIVGQLFVEALVLSVGAAVIGVGLAEVALRQMNGMEELGVELFPFWMDFGVSSAVIFYVAALAVLAAVIAGVVPALKATGRRVRSGLNRLDGGSGMRMGRTWTGLIVAQVAFAVAVLPATISEVWELRHGIPEPAFAADEFLSARLVMDRDVPPSAEAEAYEREFRSRLTELRTALVRRLEAEPGPAGVTYASHLPGREQWGHLTEVEGMPPDESSLGHQAHRTRVDVDFFDVLDVPLRAGRSFDAGDLASDRAVIVDRMFVEKVLGGRNALGRRVRYVGTLNGTDRLFPEPGPWYEIVGVVDDLVTNALGARASMGTLYHPMDLAAAGSSVAIALRAGPAPAEFAPRFRQIAATLDPALRLDDVLPLDDVAFGGDRSTMRLLLLSFGLVTLSVLLLSAAGISALMAFTVARRRREIGIRAALGADPRRLLTSVFSRALRQLAIGVAVGILAAALLLTRGDVADGGTAVLLAAVAALMMAVGLLAALGPARHGLRIQPTEALREE